MKKHLIPAAVLALLLAACSGSEAQPGADSGDVRTADSSTAASTKLPEYLEDLLAVESEARLKSMYGADRVSWDTIWGAEGTFEMGSYLDKGKDSEAMLFWGDSLRGSGVLSVAVKAKYDKDGKEVFNNQWASRTGVKLGMNTDELEQLNGKPFIFSGFGWDYGGGVMDWNGGKLQDAAVNVGLSEGADAYGKISEPEMQQVLGDHEVQSDNPVVKKVKPVVARLSVYKAVK